MTSIDSIVSPIKKILILCQRKTGKCNGPYNLRVENTTVMEINRFVSTIFPGTVTIEYLTDGIPGIDGTADHYILLSGIEGDTFVSNHLQYYDAVILNTCPLPAMDYSMIHKILNDNGLMILKAYNCEKEIVVRPEVLEQLMWKKNEQESVLENINKYFTAEQSVYMGFRKKARVGGRSRKSRKRVKSRRRKI